MRSTNQATAERAVGPENDRDAAQVLVLDDEPSVRMALGRFLQAHGYRSLEIASVEQAGRLLTATDVQALILDVRLLGKDSGLDLLAALRSRPALAATPAIVLTGDVLTDEEEREVARHRAHLFYKPEGLGARVGFLRQLTGRDQPS